MCKYLSWLSVSALCFLLFSSIVTAGPGTDEIVLYEHPNFVGQSKTYTLKPGERHRIIHDLGSLRNKISSLQTGSDVAVVICANPPGEYQAVTDLQGSLTGLHETVKSTAFHDALIIYRPKQGFPGHIVLESIGEKSSGLFTSHNPGRYYYFEPGIEDRNILEVGRLPEHTNDNFDQLVLSPGKLGSINVSLYPHPQFMGTPLEFPGEGSSTRIFSLWDFNIGDQVSSFILTFEPALKVGGAVSSKPKPAPAPMLPVTMEAKPISISRPIQLEKFTDFVPINKDQSSSGQVLGDMPGSIDGCDLVTVEGNKMVLSLHYRTAPTMTGEVYSGAFIYDANQQAIDSGYKPNALTQMPAGTTQTILALPPEPFQSQYVMTFLIQSGKVIINGRFKLPFLWDGQNGRLIHEAQAKMNPEKMDAVLQNKAQFCHSYADQALAQYEFAVKHKLSGIVPPVWSNDYDSHYNWCMTVPTETAIQGNEIRSTYLKKHAAADAATLPDVMTKKPAALPEKPILKGPGIKKPIQTKGFDPGRGP